MGTASIIYVWISNIYLFFPLETMNTRHFNDFFSHITQKPPWNTIKQLTLCGLHEGSATMSSMAVKWIITQLWPCKYLNMSKCWHSLTSLMFHKNIFTDSQIL